MVHTLLTVFCALLLLHIHADAYNYVPVVNFVSKAAGDGSKSQSIAICKEIGGFLVTEATESIHNEVINQAAHLGVGQEWYSFLGADTLTINPINCRPDSLVAPTAFDSNCMWRWNQGRWINLPDPESELLKEDHMGVTFFKGNNYFMTDVKGKGPVQGFPIWFRIDRSQEWTTLRPSVLTLRHLIAVGSDQGSVWSDNNDTGGYTYANYNFSTNQNRGDAAHLDLNAIAASRSKFVTICNAYTPDRSTMEQYNTSSGLQLYWWGILLAFLLLLCVITFIVVAACQEREDMDEPPEDAPEWAEEQQENVKRTKSFVSTRSFRKYDDDDNDLDNISGNNNSNVNDINTDYNYNRTNKAASPFVPNTNGYSTSGNAYDENMDNLNENYSQRPSFRNGNQSNYTTNPLFGRNPSVSEQANPRQPMQNNWIETQV